MNDTIMDTVESTNDALIHKRIKPVKILCRQALRKKIKQKGSNTNIYMNFNNFCSCLFGEQHTSINQTYLASYILYTHL